MQNLHKLCKPTNIKPNTMGEKLQKSIKSWKELLLDFSKKNRLLNFTEGKRSNVKITSPSFDELYDIIVTKEDEIAFPYAKKTRIEDDGEETYEEFVEGGVETTKSIDELQKTLKQLRYKANTSIEERGVNILFLAFGLLKYRERDDSYKVFAAPIVIVPVRLTIASLSSPYKISMTDDDIVVNPTLVQKLTNDFGITLPEFDSTNDSIEEYFDELCTIATQNNWEIERCTHLTTLQFLKINMYKDLEAHEDKLCNNPIICAIAEGAGDNEDLEIPDNLKGYDYDHDNNTKSIDTFQVFDADSSQQDAILLSKLGKSFVLQGPPGTGKSQTIANIIAEALADGKKILFVSEKKAALEVVYNRLAKVGLADFCLALHSDKAKKKEILQALSDSIKNAEQNNKKVRNEALALLDDLDRKKQELNQYQNELHTVIEGLNVSIFEVNGRLASLCNTEDVSFAIENIESTTQAQLNDRVYKLRELSRIIGERTESYTDNVWRNSTIPSLTNAVRHDIDAKISQFIPLLQTLGNKSKDVYSSFGINKVLSVQGITRLIQLLKFIGDSQVIPANWVIDNDICALIDNANKYKGQTEYINKYTLELSKKYTSDFFDTDISTAKQILQSSTSDLQKYINILDNDGIASDIESIHHTFSTNINVLDSVFEKAKILAAKLGASNPTSISQLFAFGNTVHALLQICNTNPTDDWLKTDVLKQIKSDIDNHATLHKSIVQLKEETLQRFDKEILAWEFYPVLQRFRGEYTSVFRIFNSSYKKDMQKIRSYISNGGRISYKDALHSLNVLKDIADKEEIIAKNLHIYKQYYGTYYHGTSTNWTTITNAISTFEQALNELHAIPQSLKEQIINGTLPVYEIEQFNTLYSDSDISTKYENVLSKLKQTSYNSYHEFADSINKICSISSNFLNEYNRLLAMRNERCGYSELMRDVDLSVYLFRTKSELEQQKATIRNQYKQYYNEECTDWGRLISALHYADSLRHLIAEYQLPNAIIHSICEDSDFISDCKNKSLDIERDYNLAKSGIDWFASLFDGKEEFYGQDIFDLINRMEACRAGKHLLEEWIDFRNTQSECDKIGLAEYTQLVVSRNLHGDDIVNAYLKRFYRLWLDAILPQFPAVEKFRSRNQLQTIEDFRELDKKQLEIAKARIKEIIFNRLPKFDSITSANDEVGILRRELNKSRKLMPLRKLFATIPNLITTLRPCFMMSPLSVSVFLDAGNYNFDMVIFDEASQVHTEDAIGAIMRGKQSIIVGDTKQLPPTNFFTTALGDDAYDIDTDESLKDDDANAYDSILDKATSVLPEKSLRWHYRSKNEDLITFSNRKIYQGNLITFPSATSAAADWGVEYIYVENGIYDRSGKRCNMAEAKRVADLVFEHFRKHPQRSLGVVTFSEAQQDAIDAVIRQRRRENSNYEKFFNEEVNEPFFIKNLETVQGDERDTIIFSIGYAKDSKGIMYMNFGPLSRDGGYRRLNVAITRAKYNIKLVGSILPTDIDLEKTSAEGVKLLRSYIEFAQQGVVALENEITVDNDRDCDSPFEESVLKFLQGKGYRVSKQVGCSGYRIDLAIKHPTLNGRFAIGIECDGATYHSARTARERDRLRQTKLEDMGWTIYRIWSTDWIKNPASEQEKLVSAIEKALHNVQDCASHNEEKDTDLQIDDVEIEEVVEPNESSKQSLDFIDYKRANIDAYNSMSLEQVVREVIKIEQPISFNELCHRVAPRFNRQKATSVVQDSVLDTLSNMKDVIRDNNWFVKYRDFDNIKVRKVETENGVRPIDDICNEELSLAMIAVAKISIGPTTENLLLSVARALGYKRASERTISKLQEIYESVLQNGKLKEEDGKVYYVKSTDEK